MTTENREGRRLKKYTRSACDYPALKEETYKYCIVFPSPPVEIQEERHRHLKEVGLAIHISEPQLYREEWANAQPQHLPILDIGRINATICKSSGLGSKGRKLRRGKGQGTGRL
jgi:hypothetical protein